MKNSSKENKYYLVEEWRTYPKSINKKIKEELYKERYFSSLNKARKYSKESIFKTKIYLIKAKLLETKNEPDKTNQWTEKDEKNLKEDIEHTFGKKFTKDEWEEVKLKAGI